MDDAGPVDWDRLTRNIGSDPAFLGRLFALFQAEKEKHVPSLRKALAENDRPLLVRAAHSLKGVIGNLCATRIFEAAARLEALSREGSLAEARALWPMVEKGLEELTQDLRRRVGKNVS